LKSILIIEDQQNLRSVVKSTLERLGYRVHEAGNGREGIEVYKRTAPDLVITDLIMPEKEGLETIRDLKKMVPDVKIIAMTGAGRANSKDFLKMARLFGAAIALSKPFTFPELAKSVEAMIGKAAPDDVGPGAVSPGMA
jgi:CheY-like chemotaxis protein